MHAHIHAYTSTLYAPVSDVDVRLPLPTHGHVNRQRRRQPVHLVQRAQGGGGTQLCERCRRLQIVRYYGYRKVWLGVTESGGGGVTEMRLGVTEIHMS